MYQVQRIYGFWAGIVCSCFAFAAITRCAALYTKRDPKFFSLRIRSLFHPEIYDPGKFDRFPIEVKE
jgi:hypothetical protein